MKKIILMPLMKTLLFVLFALMCSNVVMAQSQSDSIHLQRTARRANIHNLHPTIEIGNRTKAQHEPSIGMQFWDGEVGFRMKLRTTWDSLNTYTVDTLANRNGHKRRRFRTAKVTHDFYIKSAPTLDDDGAFEWEMIFPTQPDTNVFDFALQTNGIKFHYQDSVTFADGRGVDWTDPFIGGYVFTHTNKRNSFRQINGADTTEQNYRTGVAGVIYRPTFVDANGDSVWCHIQINTAQTRMRITVPPAAITGGVYPATLGPTFGYTTAGSLSAGWFSNEGWTFTRPAAFINGYAHEAAAGDAIVACSIYCKMPSGTGVIVLAHYTVATDDSLSTALVNSRIALPLYDTINTTAQWWGNAYPTPVTLVAGSLYTANVARGSENTTNWDIYRTDVSGTNGGYSTSTLSTNMYGGVDGIVSSEWSTFTTYETSTSYPELPTYSMVSRDRSTGTGFWGIGESFNSYEVGEGNVYTAVEGDSVIAYGWAGISAIAVDDSFVVALYVWDDSATTCVINDTIVYSLYTDSIWVGTKIPLVAGTQYVSSGHMVNVSRAVGYVDMVPATDEGRYIFRASPCPWGTIAGTPYAATPCAWFLVENMPDLVSNVLKSKILEGKMPSSPMLGMKYKGPPYDPTSSDAYYTVTTTEVAQ